MLCRQLNWDDLAESAKIYASYLAENAPGTIKWSGACRGEQGGVLQGHLRRCSKEGLEGCCAEL